ncbi:MAG: magnesium transporter CorA family protein [Actinobacteria bacterium]|nr:magnesium transporter CorA family protein [Actinomycetota bacterium]
MNDPLTRVYRNGVLDREGFAVGEVSDLLEESDTVIWVDYCDPTTAQLHEIANELGLHELAVEDTLGPLQRPKVDRYQTHIFMSVLAVRLDPDSGALDETEVDAFVNSRWIVTVRKNDRFPIEPVVERWDRSPDLAAHGVSYLLYGLLDVIVDQFFDTIQAFDDYYDEVSEGIFDGNPIPPSEHRRWFDMRRALFRFHRISVPTREVVSSLMRREHTAVSEDLYPYFQDVYDHVLRVSESSDSLRELVSTIVDTNLSLRDYHQNLIVKKVSSWAAIVAVPALITGFYGMNVPFPGSGTTAGVISASALLLVISTGLYITFRVRDWL